MINKHTLKLKVELLFYYIKILLKKVTWMLFDKSKPDDPWKKDNCAYIDWCCPDRLDWQKHCEFDQLCTDDEGKILNICHIYFKKKINFYIKI